MKNFVVLFKPIKVPNNFDSDHIYHENIHLDSLLHKEMMSSPNAASSIHAITSGYVIDEKSISFQTIGGRLCVVMLAYQK